MFIYLNVELHLFIFKKNNREFEIIVQECILATIRESIPTEDIIRAFTDESTEVEEEVVVENIIDPEENEMKSKENERDENLEDIKLPDEEKPPQLVPSITNIDEKPVTTKLSFNDYDSILDSDTGKVEEISAPKTIERLEEISTSRAIQRKLEEEEEDDEERIKIHTDNINLDELDIFDIVKDNKLSQEVSLDEIEEL